MDRIGKRFSQEEQDRRNEGFENFVPKSSLFRRLLIVCPDLEYVTVLCPQCLGSGKDSEEGYSWEGDSGEGDSGEEGAAPCCRCFGLGGIFLGEDNASPVDYRTQKELVQSLQKQLKEQLEQNGTAA